MLTVVCTSPQVLFEERILQAMLTVVYTSPQDLKVLKLSKLSSSRRVARVAKDSKQEAGGLGHP